MQALSTTTTTGGYNQKTNTGGSSANTGSQANAFTSGQLGTQAQLQGLYANLLQQLQGSAAGNVPTNFTANPNLVGAYESAYNQNVAPQEAFQGGAGSPAIASNNALGLQQLLANQYNTGVSEYQNSLAGLQGGVGSAANYALGLPTGSNQANASQYQAKTNQSGNNIESQYNPLALLGALLGGGP